MYNRYIRNEQGAYSRIPQQEPAPGPVSRRPPPPPPSEPPPPGGDSSPGSPPPGGPPPKPQEPSPRPPEGRFSRQNLRYAEEEGYTTVFWSYAYADWDNNRQPDPERAIAQILAHTHPGMVILLHPTSATNAKIMDRLLTAWEQDGYRFGSLEELRK